MRPFTSFTKISMLLGLTLMTGLLSGVDAANAAKATTTASACEALFDVGSPTTAAPLSEKELRLIAKRRKEAATYFRLNLRLPDEDAAAQLDLVMRGELTVVSPISIEDIVRAEPQAAQLARNKVVDAYTKIAKLTGRTVYEGELATSLGMKTEEFNELFGANRLFPDFTALKEAAIDKRPAAFEKIIDLSIFTPERLKKLESALLTRQRFLVTTAVANSPVDRDFFAVLVRAAKEMDAEILVFAANMRTTGLDPLLLETPGVHIITNTILLSPNLALNNIKLMAKMINPLTGLDRIGPRGQSQIVGSPKLRLNTIPTIDNDSNPHILTTTASITKPIYNGHLLIQERTNTIAQYEHRLGALVVEKSMGSVKTKLPGNPAAAGFFHFRHVTYSEKAKGFTDVDKFYTANGVSKAGIEAIVLPDIHVGEISPPFIESLRYLIKKLRPKFIAIHDLFNGHSISHHDRDKLISGAIKYKLGSLDLEGEIRSVVAFMNTLTSIDPNIEIRVELSNHDLWLVRWLEGGYFMNEPHNRALGLELAAAMVNGESPLLHALKRFGLRNPERVVFVTEPSWKAQGFELGQHGHLGANGGKGTLLTMAKATDRSISGHVHYTQRIGDNMSVGAGTHLRHGYNRNGASSWTNSFATVTEHGEAQLFILRQDEWWADKKVEPGAKFFPPGFPEIIPNNDPSVGQQIDQYSRK